MGPGMKFPRSEGGGSKEGIQGALGEEGATPEAVHILDLPKLLLNLLTMGRGKR